MTETMTNTPGLTEERVLTVSEEVGLNPERPAYEGHEVLPVTLILEGGGLRAQFTAGVLDFFMEQGVVVDHVIGVSAGALSGTYYKAGLPERTAFLNMKYCDDDRFFSMKSFRETGNVCGREFLFHDIIDTLHPFDKAWFSDSPIRLTAVSTNLETGEADYHNVQTLENDLDYLISSSSLPLLSKPVEVDGKLLLDGGTADSIPFAHAFEVDPTNKVIVVLTREAEYKKSKGKTLPVAERAYKEYPNYVECMKHRYYMYNKDHKAVLRLHEEGRIFAIMPEKPIGIKALERDRSKLLDLYAQGYEQAAKNWEALQEFLAK